jgi:hypothetical protein
MLDLIKSVIRPSAPALTLVFSLASAAVATAQEQSAAELAKAAQNPVAKLISVPFQNNTAFGIGPNDQTQNVLNIQPVIPFGLGSNWNLITRTIAPLISQPDPAAGSGGTFGLGDVNLSLFLSPAGGSGLLWGVGPILSLPTATDDVLGSGKFGIGPSVVVLGMPGNWVLGVLVNNVWSVAGGEGRTDVNSMLVQYFVNYNLPKGWYVSSAPINTVNWKLSEDKATIPLGGGFGKIQRIGRLPMNFSVQVFYIVAKPAGGPDWSLRLQAQALFPK